MSQGIEAAIARAVEICRGQPSIRAAYLVQVYAPHSNQTTTPILALDVIGTLPHGAFAMWPANDPVVIVALADELLSRFIRMTEPIYVALDGESVARSLGAVRALGDGQFAIELPDRRMPALVRDHGHAVGICVFDTKAWHIPSRPASEVIGEATTELRAWQRDEPPKRITLVHAAVAIRDALQKEFDEPWSISIPGVPIPKEMWLHGETREAAAIGVFGDTTNLDAAIRNAIEKARRQRGAHATNAKLSAQIEAVANALARGIGNKLQRSFFVALHGHATYERGVTASLVEQPGRPADAKIFVEGGAIRGEAGLPGGDGWSGELRVDDLPIDAIADAIARARRRG